MSSQLVAVASRATRSLRCASMVARISTRNAAHSSRQLHAVSRVAAFAAGTLLWGLNDHRAQCQGFVSLVPHPTHEEAVTTHISTSVPASSSWQDIMTKLRRWLQLLYRWFYVSCNYSPALLASPVLLIGTEGMKEFWWRLLIDRIKQGGPCGIKFAQWLSTRPDLFPAELCQRFQGLQSYSGGKMSWQSVQQILVESYGENWAKEFSIDMDSEGNPITVGEGCVAQVLRGRTVVGNGAVAVKVLRPEARDSVATDIEIMMGVAQTLESCVPSLRSISLVDSIEEFSALMMKQFDMRIEARSLRRFRRSFHNYTRGDTGNLNPREDGKEKMNMPLVTFPEPVDSLISEQVIVETFEPGPLLREYVEGCTTAQKKAVAAIALEAIFQMVFVDSFIHADLHPGNIICYGPVKGEAGHAHGRRPEQPRLCFIDAGLAVELTHHDQQNLVALFKAVVLNHGPLVGRLLIDESRFPQQVHDEEGFQRGMAQIVEQVHGTGLTLGRVSISDVLNRVLSLCYLHQVKIESRYAAVLVALAVVEGVVRQLDPDVDILRQAAPHILRGSAKYLLS